MAFCRNCGGELLDGAKFCNNCGAPVEIYKANEGDTAYYSEINNIGNQMKTSNKKRKAKEDLTPFEKFSKFFGIILMFIAFVDYNSDPPILTLILSLAIIIGAIFCLSQKYRLKGFTIIALIIAVFCLFAGIRQGKELGFTKVPKEADYAKAYSTDSDKADTPSIEVQTNNNTEASKPTEQPSVTTKEAEKSAEVNTIDGVDPELKAFLDSYEQFMDEYIVFMKKYMNDPGNAITMLGDYAAIMEKYEDFAEKIDKYDEKEMSTADAKYYLEVVNRCNQKMLDIYQ